MTQTVVDWEQYAEERVLTRRRLLQPHHRAVTNVFLGWFAAEDTRQSLLEVGCGDGYWLDLFRNLGFRGVEGIDISQHFVDVSKSKGHQVTCCSLDEFNPERLYDWVYAMDVLEHLPDPEAAISQMLRFLKPGGRILLCVPVFDSIPTRVQRLLRRRSKLYQLQRHDPTHLHAFSAGCLRRMLEAAGCRVVRQAHTMTVMSRFFRLLSPAANAVVQQQISLGGRFGDAFLIVAEKAG